MQLLRKILFYVFAALYLALCPLIIMYALGYIYLPGEERGIIKTGLIYLSTAPEGATVYLNGSRFTGRTPTVLRDLIPGSYNVRLMLKGYAAWSETVPVEAEKATVLESVLLLPEKWPFQLILGQKFQDIVPLTDSGFFLVKASDKMKDLFVCGYGGDKGLRVISPYSPEAEEKVAASFAPAREASSAVLVTASSRGERYVWAEISGGKVRTKDVTGLFPSRPERIEWMNDNGKYVFAVKGTKVDRIDIADGAVYPAYFESVRGFGASDNDVYVVGGDGLLYRISYDRREKKAMSADASFNAVLSAAEGNLRITVLSEDTALLIDRKGALLLNKPPYVLFKNGVRGAEYCPEKRKLLVWQKNAVSVVDIPKENLWPDEEGAVATVSEVYKGRDIRQAFWAYQGSHIVILDKDDVYLLGTETFGEPRAAWVLQVKPDTSLFYVERMGRLYYLDRTDGSLMSIDIVPPRGIMPAPITELTEKFKTLRRAARTP